ncbi:transglutaminase domain-containing protein [Demequina sp.]|uniref:transglutaminase domain-containing protein n=1 Tax=Demequina sp. TaxID=2050685 RepID=UPI0025DB9159|nr:transglutaminase domain-containing protein [Demequina sp.]
MTDAPVRSRPPAPRAEVLLAACLYAVVMAGMVWATLRPVFVPPGTGLNRFGTVVIAGIGVGLVAGVVTVVARRGPVLLAALTAVGYLAAAVLVAIPAATAGGSEAVLRGLVDAAMAPVTGWKDVVTLPVPLGEYDATQAVPLALVAATTAAIIWVGTRPRRWGLAAAVGGGAVVVAIAAGPAIRTQLGGVSGPLGEMGRETVVGLVALAATLGWVLWRMAHERRVAVRAAGGIRGARAPGRSLGRVTVAVLLVAGAVAGAAALAVPVAQAQPREVARTAVEPRLAIDRAVSPLTSYRAFLSDEMYDAPLFAVVAVDGELERIRVATLPFFDGRSFTAVAPAGYTPLRFQRVPSALPIAATGTVTAAITVDALEGPWTPLPGALGGATFGGPRAAALVDAFYYSPGTASALIAADGGIAAGDIITATAAVGPETSLAAAGASPGAAPIDADLIPDSLRDWVEAQDVTRDGAGLATLVDRLRSRGYLSHAVTLDTAPRWVTDLGDYVFEPSMAGHSYDRIDRLFTALLEREADAGPGSPDAALVAAVGDDEQFAAATALLAAELGFPARVVVGARMAVTDDAGWTPAPCERGVCRGRNMAAWTEVQTASGEWIPVDVTPQHQFPVTPAVANQRDPELPSATDPERAEAIDAVAALKGRSGGAEVPPVAAVPTPWFTGWVRAAVLGGALALLLVGPVAAIVIAKAARRARRRRGTPTAAAQGGWDEYVDAGVDAGHEPMPVATRLEVAAAFGTVHGAQLAALADRATFTGAGVDDDDARTAWRLLAADRAELRAARGPWRRLGTRLSTRSLLGRRTASAARARQREEAVDERWRALPARVGASSLRGRS